ncbi:NAD(P)-dependent alcohol dehydrogenase [Rhodobacter sp. Har01]|uniref:NAD(P)-dependent alcohol dehydrogenase n=1 Tax=Rhodobacter sp. Har01 TaxID=2883999 RepID=UPI001D088791|nr:NAD(P)-dependent alcohol dehydrogenase [Rhodobacter sp. Har01]MCB6178751.1 NAD(P)-dependent alcohol dehydrogenase [Rhodobacter sp. Har01]
MKAALCRHYGPPEGVKIANHPRPIPRGDQALVRVTAAAVTLGDARLRAARVPAGMGPLVRLAFGLRAPRHPVLGMNFAGILAQDGPFPQGTRVMGVTGLRGGAHAEYVAAAADRLFPIPQGLTDAEAAGFFFGGLTAASYLLDKARLAPGTRLLVNGATGEVGCAAIQIAAHAGAQLTATARAENHGFARSLGAIETHDYRQGLPQGPFDVILDVAGTLPWARAKPLLAPGGTLLLVTASLWQTLGALLRPRRGSHRVAAGVALDTPAAMARLLRLHAEGAFRPVIGASFPFADIAKAHALADSGHKRGSGVVLMDQATATAMAAK